MMPEPEPKLIAVVLAAGSSQRFGRPKQLEPVDGIPMVRKACAAAAAARPEAVVLVAGHEAARIHNASGARFLIINEHHASGLGSSLAAAARALKESADALLVCLADQPLIPPQHFAALRDAWRGEGDALVATEFAATIGPPVLIGRDHFHALTALEGDRGAKRFLEAAGDGLRTIRCEAAAVDIDRPEDLDGLGQVP